MGLAITDRIPRMLMIAPLSSNRLLALRRELPTCSDFAPSAVGQYTPEVYVSLDTINPWSWLRVREADTVERVAHSLWAWA